MIESMTALPDANAKSIHQHNVIYIEHPQRMSGGVLLRYASRACEANSRGHVRHFTGIGERRLQFQPACSLLLCGLHAGGLHSVPHCID